MSHNEAEAPSNGRQSGETSTTPEERATELTNPVQIEQDIRVEKAKADAIAAGGGPDKQEDGLNQDG